MNNKTFIRIAAVAVILIVGIYFSGSGEIAPQSNNSALTTSQVTPSPQAAEHETQIDVKSDQELKVDRKDCFAQFNNNQTPDLLLQQKNNHLIMFFRELEAKSYELSQREVIADIAGLNKEDAFAASTGNQVKTQDAKPHEVLLADNYNEQMELPSDQRDLFDALSEKEDLSGIADALRNKTLNPTSVRFGDSLVGQVIVRNPQINVDQLQSLLAAGAEIHLETIATAVKFASSEVVIFLAENYKQDLARQWWINGMPTNLTMASAAAFRDDLFFYFMSKGINPYIDNGYEYSMLFDVMPEPVTEQQKQRALIYVVDALKHNARSTRLSTVERLKRWLPEDIQQNYRSTLTPAIEIPAELMALGNRLKSELELMQTQIAAAQRLATACQHQHNYRVENYLEELLQGNADSKNLSLTTKNLLAGHFNDLMKKEWEKAAEAQLAKTDPAALRNLEESKQVNQKLFNQIMDKQWGKALAICSTHPRQDLRSGLCAQLLHSYVSDEKANWAFIEKILPHIDRLDSSLLTPLVMHNKIDLLRKFAARGLAFDQLGYHQDPLAWALRIGNNTEAIAFLLEQGTPTKYDFPGADALDTGLAQLDQFEASLTRDDGSPFFTTPQDVALLIRAGAPIERSHIEKIQQLKNLNPDAYQALIAAVPELAAY